MPSFDDYKNDAAKGSELKDLMVLVASRMKVSDSVVAEVFNRLVTRIEALESLVGSDVVGKEDLQKYAKQVQAAKTFSPDRTKTLSAMSQNDNGEMSATFAEVQATVVSQNNYTNPESTKTALSTIFGKIWNFFGMLLKSTGTWNGSSDAQIPTTAAVQAKLDEKQGLVGINSSSGDPLKLLNQKGEWVTSPALVNVTSYTSYSSISAILSDGALPYYAHTDGSLVVYLMYVGVSTPTGPGQSVELVFCGVSNGSIYRTSFTNGSTSFAQVSKTPVFSSDNVIDSSSQSAWSTDDINVPTRAAVEAKIASAITGDIGGYIGNFAPQSVLTYQNRIPFKNGDWISMGSSGTAYYYPNNDDTQTLASISVNSGDCIYWTVDGDFVIKPSNAVQVFTESSLSDWNTLTNTGLYQVASQASGVSNSPGSGQFSCLVSDANGKITQVATGGGSVFYRFKSSGQWSSWRNVKDADTAVSADITKTTDAELGDYLQIGSGQGVNVSCSAWAKTAGTAGRAVGDNEGNELGVTYQQKKQIPAIGPKWQTQGQTIDHTDDSRVGSIVTVAWRGDSSYTDIRDIISDTVSDPYLTNDNGRIYAVFNMKDSDRVITYLMGGPYQINVPAGKFVFILKFENNYWPYKD